MTDWELGCWNDNRKDMITFPVPHLFLFLSAPWKTSVPASCSHLLMKDLKCLERLIDV